MLTRRAFLNQSAALGAGALAPMLIAPWARAAAGAGPAALSGAHFDLSVSRARVVVEGRESGAVLVNQVFPGPLLRWREGDDVMINVANLLDEDTSIHWHGVLLPAGMDGVPGVSFPGIRPHETFRYRFPVKQAGTYWYHSHSGLQEQIGHYGPIIIDPRNADPVAFDREHVVMLGDWTYDSPEKLFRKLKKSSEAFNYQKRTLGDFFSDAGDAGLGAAFAERAMWGDMRMAPTDIADVTGAVYAYLINGRGPGDNWTGLFAPGERVRLRIINASAMTIFNLRIPGLAMRVVQADGLNVEPVETDEIQIGVAETYDVIVEPADRAYTVFAETIDRSGFARGTLSPREGMTADVPELRERPVLTMRDMAMRHGAHGASMSAASMNEEMNHGAMDHSAMGHGDNGHGGMDHGSMQIAAAQTHDHPSGVGVDMLAEAPTNRLADRGVGLENVSHRVLTYAQLISLDENPDQRPPGRKIELHLTGNMARYMWSFDGVKFSDVDAPILFHEGERLRLTLVNDTMMNHPIHLHGMFFDVVTGDHVKKPRKHTITVKPGDRLSLDVTADAPGEWAFHCHLLYHMAAGMMQTVKVHAMAGMDHGGHDMGHSHRIDESGETGAEETGHDAHKAHDMSHEGRH
ncbi:MAG: copper resistance system multicopper oxidase [Parvularculaceae bacterium]|nr:copper resistance system multicopper oxidase [Parvularculaceae bacterium]